MPRTWFSRSIAVFLSAAEKRDVNREQNLVHLDGDNGLMSALTRSEPSPEEAVALSDLLERLMASYESRQRRMLEMRLQGYLLEEIAAEIGCCRQTVLRALERFKMDLERERVGLI
jgi:DNA-directed RNA polymerase specialized sigma24 family protein